MTEKKNNFFNGFYKWLPIIILLTGGLFASHRIDTACKEFEKELEKKVSKELYQAQLDHIYKALERIERKLDERAKADRNCTP